VLVIINQHLNVHVLRDVRRLVLLTLRDQPRDRIHLLAIIRWIPGLRVLLLHMLLVVLTRVDLILRVGGGLRALRRPVLLEDRRCHRRDWLEQVGCTQVMVDDGVLWELLHTLVHVLIVLLVLRLDSGVRVLVCVLLEGVFVVLRSGASGESSSLELLRCQL